MTEKKVSSPGGDSSDESLLEESLLEESLPDVKMTYDADNRLTGYNGEPVSYDADGNMVRGPLNGEMADFTYDCRNRLIRVKTRDGVITEYAYDAENVRISEQTGSSRSVFVTDRESEYSRVLTEEISEKNRLGLFRVKEEKTYTYGNGLLGEYRRRTDERLYYHFDNLGSTLKVTGEDGKVRHTFCYGTYGELLGNGTLSTDMASGIRFLFNGEYGVSTDKNRLNYMLTRYYNTDIRRFMNRDVLTGSIDESQSLNRYSYVQGNPVSLVDPFGLCPESTFSAFSGHALLDLLGLVFDGADLVNAIWYLAEGDVKNAVMSAGALLPVIGAVGAGGYKLAKSGIKLGNRITDAARYTRSFARYADKAGTAVKCAGRKYDDIKTAIKTALKKSDGAKAAGKAVGKSGRVNYGVYSTKIDSKVTVIEKQELPSWLVDTYKDGQYRTVVTNEDINVYRSFGYNAEIGGSFATSNPAVNRVKTKVDSAILPEWKNTLKYEAEIVIPKGTTLNIGRVGEQYTMSGARLAGGADQFLLPQNWDLKWIKSIRTVKP